MRHIPVNGEFDRLFDTLMAPFSGPLARVAREPFAAPTWAPAVDVREDPDAIVLQADVPGLRPEDLTLSFEKGVLTLAGERKAPAQDRAATVHRAERGWGAFERRFALPAEVDGNAVEASYDAGVLTVRLPRRAETKPRTIEIKAR